MTRLSVCYFWVIVPLLTPLYGAALAQATDSTETQRIQSLIARSQDEDPVVRRAALVSLRSTPDAPKALVRALDNSDNEVRRDIVETIASFGLRGPISGAYIGALKEAVRGDNLRIAWGALSTLRSDEGAKTASLAVLPEGLESPFPEIRSGSACTLALSVDWRYMTSETRAKTLSVLSEALQNPDSNDRVRVTEALGKVAWAAGPTVSALTHATEEEQDPSVKNRMQQVLGQIDPLGIPWDVAREEVAGDGEVRMFELRGTWHIYDYYLLLDDRPEKHVLGRLLLPAVGNMGYPSDEAAGYDEQSLKLRWLEPRRLILAAWQTLRSGHNLDGTWIILIKSGDK